MKDKDTATKFASRAAKVRVIAKGIFDKEERQFLLQFVADAEKLVESETKQPD